MFKIRVYRYPDHMRRKSRFAVLGVLTLEPASGYDIRKFLEQTVGFFWTESFGQIYPVLRQLESEGAVVAVADSAQGRSRTTYTITDAGRKQLMDWIVDDRFETRGERNELLLKVFFADESMRPALVRQLSAFRSQVTNEQRRYAAIRETVFPEIEAKPGYRHWLATLRFGEITAAAKLEWCDETMRSFRND